MGVMAARLRRVTLQAQNDQYALHWELPMVVNVVNTSIELSNWGLDSSLDGWYEPFKKRRFEDLKLPVKDKGQSQNGCFSRSPAIDK